MRSQPCAALRLVSGGGAQARLAWERLRERGHVKYSPIPIAMTLFCMCVGLLVILDPQSGQPLELEEAAEINGPVEKAWSDFFSDDEYRAFLKKCVEEDAQNRPFQPHNGPSACNISEMPFAVVVASSVLNHLSLSFSLSLSLSLSLSQRKTTRIRTRSPSRLGTLSCVMCPPLDGMRPTPRWTSSDSWSRASIEWTRMGSLSRYSGSTPRMT